MVKQSLRKIEKQIKESMDLLKQLEIRPCLGDKDIKQKETEISDLRARIKVLEKERDGYIYHRREKTDNDNDASEQP